MRFRSASAALVAALVACGGDPTAPVDQSLDEVLDQLTATQAATAAGSGVMGGFTAPAGPAATACTYNASNQRFECPPMTHSGLTMTRWYQLLDASGTAQSAWGLNVVAIRNVSDMTGTMTITAGGQTITIQMNNHDDMTVSGLRTTTHTMTGTGTSTHTQTTPVGTITMNGTRTTNLTVPVPTSAGQRPYPTGTTTMTSTQAGSSFTSTMTMTYNGTSTVTMSMTATGMPTRTCTFNLETRTQPVCSQP